MEKHLEDNLNVNDKEENHTQKSFSLQQKILIAISSIVIVSIIIIVIILLSTSWNSSETKDEIINYGIGQIKCVYKIDQITNKIKILGEEFNNLDNIEIIFENKKINFDKEIQFKDIGKQEIIFIINKDQLNMDYIFKNVSSLISVEIISDKNNDINITSMISSFEACNNLLSVYLTGVNTIQVKSMKKLFYKSTSLYNVTLDKISTGNLTDMSYMFSSTAFTYLNLSNFNTENVEDLSYAFCNCSKLKSLNIESFNTKNVLNMSNIFQNCFSLSSIDISNFDTSHVKNMSSMFDGCRLLKSFQLSNFDTSKVIDMSSMFLGCISLPSLNLENLTQVKLSKWSQCLKDAQL